jgi:hypothetical protein
MPIFGNNFLSLTNSDLDVDRKVHEAGGYDRIFLYRKEPCRLSIIWGSTQNGFIDFRTQIVQSNRLEKPTIRPSGVYHFSAIPFVTAGHDDASCFFLIITVSL